MTSEISSRAACLAEFISNPKSFFNCPDMHGGSGSSEGRSNAETLNGVRGTRDIEGKATRVEASECGQRTSFKR